MELTKTRAELVNRALRKLQADGGTGQSPEDEDVEAVDGIVDSVIADLAERSIIYIDDVDAIPVAAFEKLADVLARAAARDFGKAGDQEIYGNAVAAEGDLRRMTAARPTYEVLKSEYF